MTALALPSSYWLLALLAGVALIHLLRRQRSRAIAPQAKPQRSIDRVNLAQIHELVIRRMKTGVLLVDDVNHIHLMNETAWVLLGTPAAEQRDLGQLAPELSRRVYQWLSTDKFDEASLQLTQGEPEVAPHFVRLAPHDDSLILVFLDDTSLVSRRAEELTLTTLGRLSASIAHEIRNPLAAIRYSAQLLNESTELSPGDQRMVEIINNHCRRLNETIENVLQLSRRDRSHPELLVLDQWIHTFIEEYKQGNNLGEDSLRAFSKGTPAVRAMVDPQQLHQVVWNLVQNALRHGRLPGSSAHVLLTVRLDEHGMPVLEVIDRGPGIAPKIATQIFEPFYTTYEYGTGLGLYLARQMSEANQAMLEYVRVPGGGSCFRLSLTPPSRRVLTNAPSAHREGTSHA